MNLDAIACASRLQALGIVVRSPELREQASRLVEFQQNGGNRAMRRAAARSAKRIRSRPRSKGRRMKAR